MDRADLISLKRNLPEFPGIYGKSDYLNFAVLVSLVFLDGEFHFLFEKRANHIRQGGEICFPGGEYDSAQDDTFRQTAVRETVEELGVARERISIAGLLDTVVVTVGSTIDSFIGILDIKSLDELSINPAEVEKVFVLPVAFFENYEPEKYKIRLEVQPSYIDENDNEIILLPFEKLGLPKRYHKPWGRNLSNILVYKTDEGLIWGITAALIYQFIKKLRNEETEIQ